MTFAAATVPELEAGEAAGLRTTLIGLGGTRGVPAGAVVSFGLAGALRDDLPCCTVLDAVRVVDENGTTLWDGEPLGVPGGRPATLLAARSVVDDPDERRDLASRTGADAVDLETGAIVAAGSMAGALRVVSDTPRHPLSGLERAVRPDGTVSGIGAARAFLRSPFDFLWAVRDGRRALHALQEAARSLG